MRWFALALLFLISCKPSSKTQRDKNDSIQKIISTELGANSTVTKNSSGSFALAYFENQGSVQYIVVRLADQKVVIKEKIRGSVSWVDDMHIQEARIPGIVKKDSKPEDYNRIIDLNSFVVLLK